ncbi:nucleotidyltransferase [Bacillus horti]|uniref:tRNA(Met) cytidine acetate ligase n=1 Tax=Caldalkalibacillus horti TaxID=77523 RepID=A0ABT9VUB2_9BACI|nr:nucleotidyltransferase [Bacillus horti]MDQ0164578.1 putative nucleotidyltransferase [Bacillus horti]
MSVVGLVVEYNPLHNGHYFHFEQAKKTTQADATVIVMSGNFLQRGEPALVDKWARTEMALRMGADLVLELPYVFATQHAQHFAFGAISILHQLPFVTHLCFGSEHGEINPFLNYAAKLVNEPLALKEKIRSEMKSGISYPQAYMTALEEMSLPNEDPAFLKQPNNILGLQYVVALKKLNSQIQPTTIKREKAGYNDTSFSDQHIASATSIRKAIFDAESPAWNLIRNYVPDFTFDILLREAEQGKGPISWESFAPQLFHTLLSQSPEQVKSLYEIEEGIEYRLRDKASVSLSIKELIEQTKTKRYTWNRIQRMLVHILHQFPKLSADQLKLMQGASYLRLLGYSTKGRELLNQSKKELQLPLISAIKKEHPAMLDWDIHSSRIYSQGFAKQSTENRNRELKQPPIAIK